MSEGERAFWADAIVPRRIYAAIRYTHIAAAIDVHAISVGIDDQIVDGEIVDAGRQNAEVSAPQNGKVVELNVMAVLQRDGLVAYTKRFRTWLLFFPTST